MASEKDAFRCVDDPNFAIVCAFLEKFAPICGIEHPDVQELQTMLENTEEVGPELMDLHIKLMRKTKYTVRPDRWERSLVKFTHSFSNVDAWELEKFGYKKLRLPVRLRILKALLECQFDSNVRFKTAVNGIAANDLRPQPLGRDKEGNAYWSTLDQRCNLRIYQEHLDEETWRVVATSRDELVKLIAILNGNEPIVPNLEGLVDEDSSSNSNGLLLKGEHVLVKQDSNSTSLSDDALLPKKKSQETGKCEAAQDDSNKAVNDKAETTAMKAEESNEKDVTEEESSDEEEMEEFKEEKPPEPPEKIPPIKLGGLKNKFNKPSLVSSFAKKEVKTSSRSQRYSRRLAGSVKEVEEEKFSIPDTVLKRPKRERLTLLGKSNIEKINKFKKMDSKRNPIIEENDSEEQDDSDEGEEEEEAEDEEEEDDEEEEEEEEDEEEEYSEAIEEKLMIVKGAGSGRDCEGGNPPFECSEVIVEETMYIQGEGSGVDCDVGNTKDDEKGPESSGSKPMFFFGQPGCLKLSPMKQSVSMEIGFGERPPVDDVTAARSSVSDSINDQKENCTDIVKNEESCSEGEIKESNKISELTEEACKDIEMNPLNDCGGSQENKLNIETESREEQHATNEIDPKEGTSNQKDLEVETEGLTKLCSIPSLETQIEKIDTDSSFQGKLIENASEDMKIDDLEKQEASQSISQVDITDKSLSTEKLLVEENEETIETISESKKIEEITESSDLNVKEDNTIEKTSEELQKDPNEDEFEASTSQPLAQVPEQLTIEDIKENEQIDETKESNIAIKDTLDASNSLSHEDLAEPTNQSIELQEKPQECGKENEISDKTDDSQSLNVEKKSFEDVSSEEDSQTFLDYDEKVQKSMGNVEEKLSKDSVGSEKFSENLDGGEISSRNLYSEEMSSEKLNKGENFPRNVDVEENPSMDLEFAGKCQMEVDVEEKCSMEVDSEEKSMLIEAKEEKIPVDAASEEKCSINEGTESTSEPSAELTSGPSAKELIEPSTESTNAPLKEEVNEPVEEPSNEELKESSNLPLFEEKIPSNLELEEKCEIKENLQENFPLDVTMEEKYSMEVDSESALGVNATDRCPMDVDLEEKSLLIADSEAKESSLNQGSKEEEISEEKDLVSNEMEVVESQITNLSVATPEEVKTFESTSTFVDEKGCDETQDETQEVVKSEENNKDQGEFSGTEELLSVERKEESSSTEAVKSLEVCEEQEESEKLLESEREEDSSSAEVPFENSMDVEISVEGSSKDVVDKSDTAVIDNFHMSSEKIPEDVVPKEKSDVDPEDSEKDTPAEEGLPIESPKELADELLPETTTEEQLETKIEAINEPPTEETNESTEVVAKEPSTTVMDELQEEEAIEPPKESSDELIFAPSTSQTESINEPQPESSAEIQIEASSKSLDDLQTESMTELPREEISDPQEQEASESAREQSTEVQLEPPTESIRELLTDSKSEEQFEPSNEAPPKESFQEPSPDEQPAEPPTDLPLQEPSSYESSSQSQPLAQMDVDTIEESKDIAEESNTSFAGSIPMSPENYLDDVESQKSNEEDEKQEFSSQEKPIEESMETESTEKSKEIEDGPNTVLFENLPSTSSEISRISTVVGEEIEKSIESDKVAISVEEMLPIEPTCEDVEESKNNAETEEISNIASVENLSPDPSMDDIPIHKEKSEDPELGQEDLSTKEDQSHAQLMDVEENLITTESSNVINLSENKIIESEKIEEDFELEESEIQSKVDETPGDLFLVPTVPKIMEVFSMAHKSTEEDSQGDSSEFINELPTTEIPVKSVEIQSESAVDAEETKEVKIEDFSLQENRENEIDSMECSSLIDRITESLADEDEKSQIDEESKNKDIENQKIDKDVSYSENKIICEEEKIEQGSLERNLVGTSKALESVPQIDSLSINQIAEESPTTSENIEFKSQEEAQISQVNVDAGEKEFLSCDEKIKEVDSVDEFKGTIGEAPEKSPAENFPKSNEESLSKAVEQSLETAAPEVEESKPIEAEIAESFSEVPEDLSKSPEKKSSELAPKSPITMHKSAGEFSKEFLEPTMCLQVKPTLPEISCVPMEIEESPAAQKIVIPEVAAATTLLHDKTKEASSSSDCTLMELEVDIEEEGKVTSAASQPIFFGEVQDLSMAKGSTTKKDSKPHDDVPMEIELEDSSKKLRESSEIVLNPPNQQLIVESLNISETKKRKPTKMTAYERRRAMQGTKSSISAVIDRIKAKESESQGIQNLKTRKGIQTRIESTRELSQTTEVTELQELKTDGKIQEKETDAKKLTEIKDKVTSHEPIEKATKESENISVKIDNNNEKKIAESLEKMEKSVLPEEKSQPQSTATIPESPKIENESPENSGLSKKRKISEEKITPEKIEGKRIKTEEQKDTKEVEVTPEKSDEILDSGNEEENISILEMVRKTRGRKAQVEKKRKGRNEAKTSKEEEVVSKMETTEKDESEHQVQISPKAKKSDKKRETEEFIEAEDTSKKDLIEEKVEEGSKSSHKSILNLSMDYEPPATIIRLGRKTRGRRPVEVEEVEQGKLQLEDVIPTAKIDKKSSAAEGKLKKADVPSKTAENEESNQFEDLIPVAKIDKNKIVAEKEKVEAKEAVVEKKPYSGRGRGRGRGRRAGTLTRRLGLEIDDTAVIDDTESDQPTVRQSRRIAQLKIREEAERRKMEEEALEKMKQEAIRKKKQEQDDYVPSATSGSDEEYKGSVEKKKRGPKKKDSMKWHSGTGTSESEEKDEEEEEDGLEPEYVGSPLFKSDHEFSPESDLEDDSWVPTKMARTVKKDPEDVLDANPEHACQKCRKHDHPEWILLCDSCDKGYHCSCLKPVLFVIPEGDWFCPPCQHAKLLENLNAKLSELDGLIEEKEKEELRLARLAFNAISTDNIIKTEEPIREKSRSLSRSMKAQSSSSSDDNSSDNEPIYKLRKRRQANVSYRFNEYDALINSAIKDEIAVMEEGFSAFEEEAHVTGAGNLGRGKDISTIIEADKEEKLRQLEAQKIAKTDEANSNRSASEDEAQADKNDESSDSEIIRPRKKIVQIKKKKKLNTLDVSSEDDGSDEDFEESSPDSEDSAESMSSGSENSMELELLRKKNSKAGILTRRSVRSRHKVYDEDFINDDDSDEAEPPPPKRKKKKEDSDFSDFDSDETDEDEEDIDSDDLCDDSDSGSDTSDWRSRRKKAPPRKPPGKPSDKPAIAKKKPKKKDDDDETPYRTGSKKKAVNVLKSDDEQEMTRRTRGKKINFLEDYYDDSSDDGIKPGVKRPDTPPEEREKFIKKQEEIKRMLAAKNTEGAKEIATPKLEPLGLKPAEFGALYPEPTSPAADMAPGVIPSDSISTIPLQVIQTAKALDVDLHHRAKDSVDYTEPPPVAVAPPASGDFNPEDMNEEELARMMEDESFAQQQLKLAGEAIRNKKLREAEINRKAEGKEKLGALSAGVLPTPPIAVPVYTPPARSIEPPSVLPEQAQMLPGQVRIPAPPQLGPNPHINPLQHPVLRPTVPMPFSPGPMHMPPQMPQHQMDPRAAEDLDHAVKLTKAGLVPKKRGRKSKLELQAIAEAKARADVPPYFHGAPAGLPTGPPGGPPVPLPTSHPQGAPPGPHLQAPIPPSTSLPPTALPPVSHPTTSHVANMERPSVLQAPNAIVTAAGEPIIPTTVLSVQGNPAAEKGDPDSAKKRGRRKKITPLRDSIPGGQHTTITAAMKVDTEPTTSNPILAERLETPPTTDSSKKATPPQLYPPGSSGGGNILSRLQQQMRPLPGSFGAQGLPGSRYFPPPHHLGHGSLNMSLHHLRANFAGTPTTSAPGSAINNGLGERPPGIYGPPDQRGVAGPHGLFRGPGPMYPPGHGYQGQQSMLHHQLQSLDPSIGIRASHPQEYQSPYLPPQFGGFYAPSSQTAPQSQTTPTTTSSVPVTTAATSTPPVVTASTDDPPATTSAPATTTAAPAPPYSQFETLKSSSPHENAPHSYSNSPAHVEAGSTSEFSGLVSYFSSQQDDLES